MIFLQIITAFTLVSSVADDFNYSPIDKSAIEEFIKDNPKHHLHKDSDLIQKHIDDINSHGLSYGIPPALLFAIARDESGFRLSVGKGKDRGNLNEQGYMQAHGLAVRVCKSYGVDPNSIECGACYLSYLRFNHDINNKINVCIKNKICSGKKCWDNYSESVVSKDCNDFWNDRFITNPKNAKKYSEYNLLKQALRSYMGVVQNEDSLKRRIDDAIKIEKKHGAVTDFGG